jgi:sulfatase modifying factor 1
MKRNKLVGLLVIQSLLAINVGVAQAVFIETVVVGNAGNAPDTEVMVQDGTTGYGAVSYDYRIGKYEVTNAQYTEFLNAVDPVGTNTLNLYVNAMSTSEHGGINFDAAADNGSKCVVKLGHTNKPVTFVSWYDAIRFANWLHNGQGSGDTETGAYEPGALANLGIPVNGNNITRNLGAKWFLPTENEWYKAAFHKNGGASGNYWSYPTSSDSAPTADAPPGGTNSANFDTAVRTVSDVGAYPLSDSPYGTFDQAGNLWEWNETLIQRGPAANPLSFFRGTRGGAWSGNTASFLASSNRITISFDGPNPSGRSTSIGFRVASISTIPEPSSLLLIALAIVVLVDHAVRFR